MRFISDRDEIQYSISSTASLYGHLKTYIKEETHFQTLQTHKKSNSELRPLDQGVVVLWYFSLPSLLIVSV